jgi:hypothetical protein
MFRLKIGMLALGMAMCFPMLLDSNQLAFGAPSSSSSGSSSFSYSSKVSGNSVTIYASSSSSKSSKTPASKSTTSVTKPKSPASSKAPPKTQSSTSTKSPAKSVTKSVVTSKPKLSPSKTLALFSTVVSKTVPITLKKPSAPKATIKIPTITKTQTSTKIVVKVPGAASNSITSQNGEASFSPDSIDAAVFPATVAPNEPVYLSAPASQHYRLGIILGKNAEVRFTPIQSTWIFSDGSNAIGSNPSHSFGSAGTYSATVSVQYLVSYRLAGQQNWQLESSAITLTDQVQIMVKDSLGSPSDSPVSDTGSSPGTPYLVRKNCIENPAGFACQ